MVAAIYLRTSQYSDPLLALHVLVQSEMKGMSLEKTEQMMQEKEKKPALPKLFANRWNLKGKDKLEKTHKFSKLFSIMRRTFKPLT